MSEIDIEPQEEAVKERHPADTLNDGSALKFVFYVPALLLHTLIVAVGCPLGVAAATAILNMRPSYGRYFWPGFILEFIFSGLMGYAWTNRLDKWLFGTSRWVWILPAIWFAIRFIGYQTSIFSPSRMQHFFGRMDDMNSLHDQLFVVVPFVCAVGYAIGALVRRRKS
jgi:hypothetical protein